ncbi:DUF3775 domain-containing protein [Pseudooceanicola sp.]|uniref:DUF3775 domain-containing protein n=1 Tax=Pseudooceanicola sp. TaxID=1914328 RepID=UPI002619F30B|nr:DUF3775 domain-containing protein [Pseudooceanicola sp.]MDF1855100.1 DUF3775 domain-containing protein [Pseudooceanicola sp.]
MLDISERKIAQVVLMAHEMHRAEGELRAFIDALNEDEAASLVALYWIGRGAYEPEELEEAKATALREATAPTSDYLLGSPHMADHLEAGIEALGLEIVDDEDDLMRGV